MSATVAVLPVGSLLNGVYEVREHLGPAADGHLYLALAGDGGRISRQVLLARGSGGAPDLRDADPGARMSETAIPALSARFEANGQSILALGCHGGTPLTRITPLASDEGVLALLCELAAGLMQLVSQGASTAGFVAEQILLLPDGAVCYVGPVTVAGADERPVERLAALAGAMVKANTRYTIELSELLEQLHAPGGFGSVRAVMSAMVALVGTGDLVSHAAVSSDAGPVRTHNEDAAVVVRECQVAAGGLLELDLAAVADGLGGHRDGARAAQLALTTLTSGFGMAQAVALASGGPMRWQDNEAVWEALEGAVAAADETVAALAESDEAFPPASTLVVAVRVGRRLFVRHLGDSRCYLLRGRRIERLTRDDSLVQELVDGGRLAAAEAASHPDANLITCYVGGGQKGGGAVMRLLQSGDRVLLCSDGATSVLSDAVLADLLASHRTAEERAEAVVIAACAAGSGDNVTAAVLDLEASERGIGVMLGEIG